MRKENGTIVIDKLEIPLSAQKELLPILLDKIPDSCDPIGINFKTYWDFERKTRRQFLINAVRRYTYPTTKQMITILAKEASSTIDKFLSWVGYTREVDLDKIHKKWTGMIRKAFESMTHAQALSTWNKQSLNRLLLVTYIRKDFFPLVMGTLGKYGQDPEITRAIEKRLKGD